MAVQGNKHVQKCCQYVIFNVWQQMTPMESIIATHLLELVHIDYLCLKPKKGKAGNVLVVMDHFTWYAQAYVTQSQMAQTMAKVLWDNFIIHSGLPEKILLDQGRNFESELIADLCKLTCTMKFRTSPYHPQTNGECKRFNSTLINMLGMLLPEQKSDWKGSIGMLGHAYNCIFNSTMGFSPYFLMYGRQPQLPIDVTLRISAKPIATTTSSKYIQKLRAHRKANLFQGKEVQCHKQNYD